MTETELGLCLPLLTTDDRNQQIEHDNRAEQGIKGDDNQGRNLLRA